MSVSFIYVLQDIQGNVRYVGRTNQQPERRYSTPLYVTISDETRRRMSLASKKRWHKEL